MKQGSGAYIEVTLWSWGWQEIPVHLQGDSSVACQLVRMFLLSFHVLMISNNVSPWKRKINQKGKSISIAERSRHSSDQKNRKHKSGAQNSAGMKIGFSGQQWCCSYHLQREQGSKYSKGSQKKSLKRSKEAKPFSYSLQNKGFLLLSSFEAKQECWRDLRKWWNNRNYDNLYQVRKKRRRKKNFFECGKDKETEK